VEGVTRIELALSAWEAHETTQPTDSVTRVDVPPEFLACTADGLVQVVTIRTADHEQVGRPAITCAGHYGAGATKPVPAAATTSDDVATRSATPNLDPATAHMGIRAYEEFAADQATD
jgi:hypothetical protein